MGRLIVLEGVDGTGKSTQFDLLCRRVAEAGIRYRALSYPDYADESSTLVRMYLAGKFGSDPDDVNPYAAGTFYACDRYASYMRHWREDYEADVLCLACRYTSSNAVHQGAKLERAKREAYYKWLADFEYVKMGIPRPDRVVLLKLPVETALENIRMRDSARDIHEADEAYLRRCTESAGQAADFFGWHSVACSEAGRMRTRQAISDDIFREISDLL